MRRFSDRDLDRPWSAGEVARLSEKDVTILAIRRDVKNGVFFVFVAAVAYVVAAYLGTPGRIVGWVAIALLVVFALHGLFNLGLGIVSTIGVAFADSGERTLSLGCRIAQLLLSIANFSLYALLAFAVYSATSGSAA